MSGDALKDALRALARAIDALADAFDSPAPDARFYTSEHLPPGCPSWRAARETALREGIPTVRPGRHTLIDAPSWDAWVASKRSTRRPHTPPELTERDAEALKALGVVVTRNPPRPPTSRRRA